MSERVCQELEAEFAGPIVVASKPNESEAAFAQRLIFAIHALEIEGFIADFHGFRFAVTPGDSVTGLLWVMRSKLQPHSV